MRGKFALMAVAAGTALATLSAAPAYADEIDDIFIGVLDDEGIPYTSPGEAITVANAVCSYMADGNTLVDATYQVMEDSGLGAADSGFFVGAAAAAYCPDFAP